MPYPIPEKINEVLTKIRDAGFRALPVGGCVRDLLRGKTPHDWDITSSATPDELLRIFNGRRIAPLSNGGIKHGTVTVIIDHQPIEITTFRCDGEYSDGRRPDSVGFSRELSDDLCRRDFTINALCIDEQGGIVDMFGGRDDLEKGIIRAIGDPDKRFYEDSLRILRALRFAAAFGFEIEPATAESMHKNIDRIDLIAAERISDELIKLICAPDFLRIALQYKDILCKVLPELAPMVGLYQRQDYHCFDVYDHTMHTVAQIRPDPLLRLTMLLHDVGKPVCSNNGHFFRHEQVGAGMAEEILKRLNCGKAKRERIVKLIDRHSIPIPTDRLKIKKLLAKYGDETVLQLLEVKRADNMAKRENVVAERIPLIDKTIAQVKEIMNEKPPLTLRQLAVSGNDLMQLGLAPGPEMGSILNEMLESVVAEQLKNDKQTLLDFAKAKISEVEQHG